MFGKRESKFYSVLEAARVLEVSAETVRRWVRNGTIEAIRLSPRTTKIRKETIDRLIRN